MGVHAAVELPQANAVSLQAGFQILYAAEFLVDKADKVRTLFLDIGDVLIVAGNGVCVDFTPFGG